MATYYITTRDGDQLTCGEEADMRRIVSERPAIPGIRITTLLGRKGVLLAVERVWLTVAFDDRPEWPCCYHAFDKWIYKEDV